VGGGLVADECVWAGFGEGLEVMEGGADGVGVGAEGTCAGVWMLVDRPRREGQGEENETGVQWGMVMKRRRGASKIRRKCSWAGC